MKNITLVVTALLVSLSLIACGGSVEPILLSDSAVTAGSTLHYADVEIDLSGAVETMPPQTVSGGTVCTVNAMTEGLCSPGAACSGTSECLVESCLISLQAYSTQTPAELCTHAPALLESIQSIAKNMPVATADNASQISQTYVWLRAASVDFEYWIATYCTTDAQ